MKFTYTNPSKIKKSGSFIKSVKGFSLVELLVVIAVIGVIAAIAIPAISGITGQAGEAKVQRNAQSLSSTFSSARAAGNVTAYATEIAAADAVIAGMTGEGTSFGSTVFKVPGISNTERDAALKYLSLSATTASGMLEYNSTKEP